jgi:hypothetical protein
MPKEYFYSQNSSNNDFQLSSEMRKRHEFSESEVGITHPDLSSFIRLNDSGDIEVFAEPGVGFIINAASRTITFFADTIKFHCKDDGLRWNSYTFNPSSTSFIEPTLVKTNMDKIHPAIYNISNYLNGVKEIEDQERSQPVTIEGDFSFTGVEDRFSDRFDTVNTSVDSRLTEEEINLLNNYSLSNTSQKVNRLLELINSGATFFQAQQKVTEELG